MYEDMSGSSVPRGVNESQPRKEDSRAKFTNWILIALSVTVIFCIITIFVLLSKVSSLQENYSLLNTKYDKNLYLNPTKREDGFNKNYTLTPQTLDSQTTFTDITPSYDPESFKWNSPAGGYGTCEVYISTRSCENCQFALKANINNEDLYPSVHSFTMGSASGDNTATVQIKFVLAQSSNLLGLSLALIGDPNQGDVTFFFFNVVTCYLFGVEKK